MKKLPCWLKSVVSNNIQAWYLLMQNEFGVDVVNKKNSRLMRLVAFFLGIIRKFIPNICTQQEFMEDYTTTIYGTIYVSYEISELQDKEYVEEIGHLVHEMTHVEQFRRELLMPAKYLFSSHWRMVYEVEAFCRTLEYLIRAKIPDVDFLAFIDEKLYSLRSSYGVSPEDIRVATNKMQAFLLQCRNGTSKNSELVTKAIEFWECLEWNRK